MHRPWSLPAIVCLLVPHGWAGAQTPGQTGGKSVQIVRADSAPVIDGILDEAAWNLAGMVDDFHQIDPNEYDEPTQVTRVYLLYDDTHLYIGAQMLDEEAGRITAQILRQGAQVQNDDYFGVILDPFLDRRNGYLFRVNPNSVRSEALFKNTSQTDYDWVGIWRARASVHGEGWSVEMAIPFKTLSFDPGAASWGINFTRGIARNRETMGWVSRTRAQNPGIAGTVTGFRELQQGLGLDVVASSSVNRSRRFDPVDTVRHAEPSVDIFYNFTPALTGVLTLNTDFSATEVDDRQVNLTRFSLLFPEKRDFFLQDADIFEFGRLASRGAGRGGGTGSQNGRPFFSRTIGLSQSRQPVDIESGAKLTGRVGRWNLGMIDIRQDAFENVEATNLFVGRAVANVLEESSLGVIVTDGDPHSNLDNSVAGVDFRYLNSRLPGRRTAEGEIWYQQSETPGLAGDDTAFGAGLAVRSNDRLGGNIRYVRLGEDFNPALGFANRVGIGDFSASVSWQHRPRGAFYRSLTFGPSFERTERLADGSLQSEAAGFRIGINGHAGDRGSFRCSRETEGLVRPFAIRREPDPAGNVVIPVGEYTFDTCRAEFTSGNQRTVAARIVVESGGFFDGREDTVQAAFVWRPSSHFALDIGYQVNDIDLPYGAFVSRLGSLRSDLVFSSTLSWVNLVQWDNASDEIGINSRLHWIPRAGREVYLVLNHGLNDLDRDGSFRSSEADMVAKVNYTFRF